VDVVADCRKVLNASEEKFSGNFLLYLFRATILYSQKNQNELVAQYSFLLVFRSAACFGQIYWLYSAMFRLRIISCGYNGCVYNY